MLHHNVCYCNSCLLPKYKIRKKLGLVEFELQYLNTIELLNFNAQIVQIL